MCASCYELKKRNDELLGYNASLQRQADEGANAKMKLKLAMERIEYLDRQLAISEELRLSGDAVIDQMQVSQRLFATAILAAHKGNGHCTDCLHVERGEDYQKCKGGEFDCCKCSACILARKILSD